MNIRLHISMNGTCLVLAAAALLFCGAHATRAGSETMSWNGGMQITNPTRGETTLRLRYHGNHPADDGFLLAGDQVNVQIRLPDGSNQMLAAQTMYRWYRAKKEETTRDFFGNTDTTVIHPSGEKKGPERRYCKFDDQTIRLSIIPPANSRTPLANAVTGGSAAHPVYEMKLVVNRQARLSELLVGALSCAAPTEADCRALRPPGEDWEWKDQEFQQQQPGELLETLPDHLALKVAVTVERALADRPATP